MTIPDKLISSCSWDEICIYILIKKSKSSPSIRVISKELNIPKSNAQRKLQRLISLGYVGTPNGTPNGTPKVLNNSIVTHHVGTPNGTPNGTLSEVNIDKRKHDFEHSLSAYVTSGKYPPEMVRAFSNYWTEFNKSRTKMRWELEKTWETSKRLATWANRDTDFSRRQEQDEFMKGFI